MITIENNIAKLLDVKLNGKLVGVVGISGGFTYLKSAIVTWQEDDKIIDALRTHYKNNN